jgi:hypothetical protein
MKFIFLFVAGFGLILRLIWMLGAISRFDVDSSVDRLMYINGQGHLIGLPTRPGTSSTTTTGVPTASIQGFAPGALFINFKGSAGSVLYVNQGTFTSATWLNIA